MQKNNLFDQDKVDSLINRMPDFESVMHFKESAEIKRLSLKFDIKELRKTINNITNNKSNKSFNSIGDGFHAISLSRRPGTTGESANDLSGRYYLRTGDNMNTYFEYVHQELSKRYPIGRMRVLMKDPYNCNSWFFVYC